MKKKSIIAGAFILTAAGIITRILGFVYRIYLSNLIGAEGMGLYQLIMPVYSLAWSISCSGFTTTVSKLTAQEKAKGEYGNMGRILKQSAAITGCIGLILCVLLYRFAGPFAIYFLKEPRIGLSLRILSLAFPFMAAGSCIRGYFFGLQETLVPAVNQVLEQCVRMLVIYLLAAGFMHRGIEYACAVAVVGIVVEELFSLVYIVAAYKIFKTKNLLRKRPVLSTTGSLALILSMAMPLTLNRVAGSLLATLENTLIPQQLQLYGLTAKEAISAFGQISGMAMPLIYFPSAVLTSLSITLVPAVSEASAVNNKKRILYTLSKSLLFTCIIGMAAAAIFIVFSRELGQAIYKQDLSGLLVPMGIMCPFIYMQMVISGALNGLGFQLFLFRNSLLSSFITIGFIYFLMPLKGMNAFILGWFVSLIVIVGLEINKLRESVQLELEYSNWFLKPMLAAAAAGLTARLVYNRFFLSVFGLHLGLVVSLALFSIIYMVSVLLMGCLTLRDVGDIFSNLKLKNTPH